MPASASVAVGESDHRREALRSRDCQRRSPPGVTSSPELGGSRARPTAPASVLVVDVHAHGAVLHRFAADRSHVGDTFHPDRSHALAQIADEYGATNLPFHEVPHDGRPLAFFSAVDDRQRTAARSALRARRRYLWASTPPSPLTSPSGRRKNSQ
jgi:hypothetical protein